MTFLEVQNVSVKMFRAHFKLTSRGARSMECEISMCSREQSTPKQRTHRTRFLQRMIKRNLTENKILLL